MFETGTFLASFVLAHWEGAGWWFIFVPLGWFLVIFTLIFLFRRAAWGGGWGCGPGGRYGGRISAADLLERRFAEGELSVEEYRERRSVLEEKAAS